MYNPKRVQTLDDVVDAPKQETAGLLDDNESEEDFFLKGPVAPNPSNGKQANSDSALNTAKAQVDEVTGIMRGNVQQLLERGERLQDLEDRSIQLTDASDNFRATTVQIRRRLWWRDLRMKLFLGACVTGILLLIIVPLILKYTGGTNHHDGRNG